METINVVLTSSDEYIAYTSVLIKSILNNTRRHVHFYILTYNISEISKQKLFQFVKKEDITFINIDLSNFPQPPQKRAHKIVYGKMYLASILPIDKCIVLDSDIIVSCDLCELFDLDIDRYWVAWVKDPIDIAQVDDNHWLRRLGNTSDYINSGVLVLNLKLWRKNDVEKLIANTAKEIESKVRFYDQDILYFSLSSKCYYLDYVYNYLPTLEYKKLGINEYCDRNYKVLHYGTDAKPWFYPSSKFANIWWSYARQTPFYEEILQRLIDFRFSQLKQQTNVTELQQLRKELAQIHFPNINNRFDANEYNTKLLFVLEHPIYFKLKKFWYAIKKAFAFGKRYQKYNQKYQNVKNLLKDAKKLKKSFVKI